MQVLSDHFNIVHGYESPSKSKFVCSVHVPGATNGSAHTQALALVLPAGEIRLPMHCSQGASPSPDLYVSTTHCVHGPPSGPWKPALHTQSIMLVLPTDEMELAGQREHPAEECPYQPAWQMQSVIDVLLADEIEFDGQSEHEELPP